MEFTESKMILADRIKERRITLNMNQTDLARIVGITQTQISRYELGIAEPIASNLLAIADALQVSVDWLIGKSNEPPDAPRMLYDLTISEQEILLLYRAKSPKAQQVVKELLEML